MEGDFDPKVLAELDAIMDVVNLAVLIRALLIEDSDWEVWVRNPGTGEARRVWLICHPN